MLQFISKYRFAFTYPCPRKLREIMQMSLIERENKDNIIKIWMEYHKAKDHVISYVVSKNEYEQLQTLTQQSPTCLIPIKKGNGHFMLIGQSQKNSILFTYLEDFKKSGTNASPYFIITMFDELLFSKGVVLMRGDVIDFKMDKDEAFFTTNQFLRLYLTQNLYDSYVHTLNHNSEQFDYEQFRIMYQI